MTLQGIKRALKIIATAATVAVLIIEQLESAESRTKKEIRS
jgi:hypothetical protein